MDWIQQWQSKLNKQNGVAPLVRTGGSRHTGLAALPHRNIHLLSGASAGAQAGRGVRTFRACGLSIFRHGGCGEADR